MKSRESRRPGLPDGDDHEESDGHRPSESRPDSEREGPPRSDHGAVAEAAAVVQLVRQVVPGVPLAR
jgi:hypothetical protein